MKRTLLIFTYLASFALISQTKGKITYRIEMLKDSIEQPFANPDNTDIQNEVLEMLHESQPVEGYLVFNDSIAIYKVEPKIEIPSWNNSKNGLIITPSAINMTWFMGGGNSTYYYNISRNYAISQNNLMGSTKRIEAKPKDWVLTDESKEIDGYLCYLATLQINDKKKLKFWYTPSIPIKHGPKGFNGLPGLILRIEDFRYTWTFIKIDFDNYEADEIIEPKEGELITEEEYKKWASSILSDN